MRHEVGVDRIMWGSDFPHREGCWPVLATSTCGWRSPACPRTRCRRWSAATRPSCTASISTRWRRSPPQVGPTVDEVARPARRSHEIPADALRCPAFAAARPAPRARPTRTRSTPWHASATALGRPSSSRTGRSKATSVGAWSTTLTADLRDRPRADRRGAAAAARAHRRAARAGHDRLRRPGRRAARRSAPGRSPCRRSTRARSATTRW